MNYDGEVVIGTKMDTDGIKEGLEKVKDNVEDFSETSKRIGENDIGEKIVEGIKFGINKNAYQATEAMKEALEELKLQKSMGLVDSEEYYKNLEKLRDKYFEKGSLGWWNYTAEIIEYETKLYAEQKKHFEKTVDEIEKRVEAFDKTVDKSFSDYEKKMESLSKKEEKFAEKLGGKNLFEKITFNTGEEETSVFEDGVWKKKSADFVAYKLTDLKDEINMLSRYDSLLSEISKKENIPDDILEYLKNSDAESGIDYMSALLDLSDDDYEKYISDYDKRSEISLKIANRLYSGEAEKIKEDFLSELGEAFGEVNEDFLRCGTEAASSFGKSFGEKIDEIIKSVKNAIESELESIECSFSVDVSSTGKGDTRIYNLYGSGETVSQKLQAARADAELERMRGGY